MGRSATTLRPAHAHTNAPRLINPWQPTAAAATDAASNGDADATGGGPLRPTSDTAGRGRPIAGKGTKSVGALWDLAQDAQKWAPPLVMASGVAKKTAFSKHPDVAATLECARAVALDRLRKKLNAAAIAAGAGAPPPQAFERWRFAATVEGNDKSSSEMGTEKNATQQTDPAVPSSVADGDGSALAALAADLTRAGVPADAAREAARATAEASKTEASNLRKLADRLATHVAGANQKKNGGEKNADQNNGGSGVRLARVSVVFRKRSVELSSDKGGHFVVLSRRAYGKLAAMYRHVAEVAAPRSGLEALSAPEKHSFSVGEQKGQDGAGDSDSDSDDDDNDLDDGHTHDALKSSLFAVEDAETRLGEADADKDSARAAFHARLFALLLRYKSIQGYGFQSGVGPRVFATLRDTVGVKFEAFASPLNCFHTKGFCSAFPDVDAPFGSRGDFFKAAERGNFRRGAIQVNPPFVGGVMTRTVNAIEKTLCDADKNDEPLSFVVFVPGWTDEKAWSSLSCSSFLKKSFVIAAADHGYCDGAAHQRKASFRSSTYDTGVFVLCSKKVSFTNAGKRFVNTNGASFEVDVREAFAGARMSDAVLAAAKNVGEKKKKKKKRGGSETDDKAKDTKESGVPNEKKEKTKENKAAKKRRKRREEKERADKKAKADTGKETTKTSE